MNKYHAPSSSAQSCTLQRMPPSTPSRLARLRSSTATCQSPSADVACVLSRISRDRPRYRSRVFESSNMLSAGVGELDVAPLLPRKLICHMSIRIAERKAIAESKARKRDCSETCTHLMVSLYAFIQQRLKMAISAAVCRDECAFPPINRAAVDQILNTPYLSAITAKLFSSVTHCTLIFTARRPHVDDMTTKVAADCYRLRRQVCRRFVRCESSIASFDEFERLPTIPPSTTPQIYSSMQIKSRRVYAASDLRVNPRITRTASALIPGVRPEFSSPEMVIRASACDRLLPPCMIESAALTSDHSFT